MFNEGSATIAIIGAVTGVLSLVVAIVSAYASSRSAASARESAEQAREAERRATLKDVVVASQGVMGELDRIEFLATALRSGYRTLFGFSGGAGSRVNIFLERVDERVARFSGIAEEAGRFTADVTALHEISSDDLLRAISKLEGARIRAQHMREEFETELTSLEEQIRPHRERALRQ